MAFLVPTANTKVSMSSSLRVTLICYKQTDNDWDCETTFRSTTQWICVLCSTSPTPQGLAIWLIHTTWSQAGLIILARTLSRSWRFRNLNRPQGTLHHCIFNTTQWHTPIHKSLCPYLELDQHAFTAHTSGAPQVVDVFIFLIQLPSAHCFFAGAVITYSFKWLTINTRSASYRLSLFHPIGHKTHAVAFHTLLWYTQTTQRWKNSPTSAKLLSRSSLCELNQAWARRLFLFLPMM